jgi:hypothetical protein
MRMKDVVDRIDDHQRRRDRERYDAPLENRRPFLPPQRRSRLQFILVGLVLLLIAGGSAVWQGNKTTAVGVDEVVERFRTERSERAVAGPGTAAIEGGAATGPVAPVAPALDGTERSSVGQAQEVDGPFALPPEGVYPYHVTGGEKLSVFGAEHRYPERVYSTTRHVGACGWEARIDVIEEHVDIVGLCSAQDVLHQTSQTRIVSFFGVRQHVTMTCEPVLVVHDTSDDPGTKTSEVRCTDGQGGYAHITRRFVGTEKMTVGGRTVKALHAHLDSELSGRVDGSSTDDIWLSPDTGMLYRWKRYVDTETGAAFGMDARYTEEADFLLESLDPLR